MYSIALDQPPGLILRLLALGASPIQLSRERANALHNGMFKQFVGQTCAILTSPYIDVQQRRVSSAPKSHAFNIGQFLGNKLAQQLFLLFTTLFTLSEHQRDPKPFIKASQTSGVKSESTLSYPALLSLDGATLRTSLDANRHQSENQAQVVHFLCQEVSSCISLQVLRFMRAWMKRSLVDRSHLVTPNGIAEMSRVCVEIESSEVGGSASTSSTPSRLTMMHQLSDGIRELTAREMRAAEFADPFRRVTRAREEYHLLAAALERHPAFASQTQVASFKLSKFAMQVEIDADKEVSERYDRTYTGAWVQRQKDVVARRRQTSVGSAAAASAARTAKMLYDANMSASDSNSNRDGSRSVSPISKARRQRNSIRPITNGSASNSKDSSANHNSEAPAHNLRKRRRKKELTAEETEEKRRADMKRTRQKRAKRRARMLARQYGEDGVADETSSSASTLSDGDIDNDDNDSDDVNETDHSSTVPTPFRRRSSLSTSSPSSTKRRASITQPKPAAKSSTSASATSSHSSSTPTNPHSQHRLARSARPGKNHPEIPFPHIKPGRTNHEALATISTAASSVLNTSTASTHSRPSLVSNAVPPYTATLEEDVHASQHVPPASTISNSSSTTTSPILSTNSSSTPPRRIAVIDRPPPILPTPASLSSPHPPFLFKDFTHTLNSLHRAGQKIQLSVTGCSTLTRQLMADALTRASQNLNQIRSWVEMITLNALKPSLDHPPLPQQWIHIWMKTFMHDDGTVLQSQIAARQWVTRQLGLFEELLTDAVQRAQTIVDEDTLKSMRIQQEPGLSPIQSNNLEWTKNNTVQQ